MSFKNVLDGETYKAADFSPITWVSADATLRRATTKFHSGFASLEVTPADTDGVLYSSDPADLTSAPYAIAAEEYRGIAWVAYPYVGTSFTISIRFYGSVSFISEVSETILSGYNPWTLLSVNGTAPAGTVYAILAIEYDGLNAGDLVFYLDDPAIVTNDDISPIFTTMLAYSLPEYWTELDEKQSGPSFPLYSYLDLIGHQGDDVIDLIFKFAYTPISEGGDVDDTSLLVDPFGYPTSGAKPEWLTWLAQLCGIRKFQATSTSSSWSSVEAYATWDDWQDSINDNPPPGSLAVSTSRTSGEVTATTTGSHTYIVGDSVLVAGITPANFGGIYEVTGVGSSTSFTYSQVYQLLEISRTGTTVTAKCGVPHNLSTSNVIVVSGTGNADLDGTFTVVSVSNSGDPGVDANDQLTYSTVSSGTIAPIYTTGSIYPSNGSSTASGTVALDSDLTWGHIESLVGATFPQDEALAYLIRTGATGIWGGTIEGIKRAARIALTGLDEKVRIECANDVATVYFDEAHGLAAAASFEIYSSPEDKLNGIFTVDTVPSLTSLTFECIGADETTYGWLTTRDVSVDKNAWIGIPLSIDVTSGTMTLEFSTPIPFDITLGTATIEGSTSYDDDHIMDNIVISEDRYSISFDSALANGSETPSGASVRISADDPQEMFNCFVIRTIESQTQNVNTVVAFASQAKPAGGVVTHQYKIV